MTSRGSSVGRHILRAVDREVHLARQKRRLERADERSFAPRRVRRALVAERPNGARVPPGIPSARSASATSPDCVIASALPRVPRRRGRMSSVTDVIALMPRFVGMLTPYPENRDASFFGHSRHSRRTSIDERASRVRRPRPFPARRDAPSRSCPGPGQESVWDYPRPPTSRARARASSRRGRWRDPGRHDPRDAGPRDRRGAGLLLPAR